MRCPFLLLFRRRHFTALAGAIKFARRHLALCELRPEVVSLAIVTPTLISVVMLFSAFVASVTAVTFEVGVVVVVEVVGVAEIDTMVIPVVVVVAAAIVETDIAPHVVAVG